jgi:hypothetical protein
LDGEPVAQAIAVERECCPFFALTRLADQRRLVVAIAEAAHEPALDAIAFALDLG